MEGRAGSYPELFDARRRGDADVAEAYGWPTWIEFNLSNKCNLQCLQCDGELSSAIRIHRERRPALHSPYGDQFFDDLVPFLTHLKVAQFAGGEPFLAAENYRVWDLIAEHNPNIECVTITNATQWSDRIEQAINSVRMGFTLSLDGITKSTYESIRIGADFEAVMRNVDRLVAHAKSVKTPISVNHCLMPQNVDEFADLLLWADGLDIDVQVSVVRGPARCAIARLPSRDLVALAGRLQRSDGAVRSQLSRNRAVWSRELARITAWASMGEQALDLAWATSRYSTVLNFPGKGTPNIDDADANAELTAWASASEVYAITVQSDDAISAVSPGLATAIGQPEADIIGGHIERVAGLFADRFGPMRSYSVTESSADRTESVAEFGSVQARIIMVPIRDGRGITVEGRLLIALREP